MKRILCVSFLLLCGTLGVRAVPWAEMENSVAVREERRPEARTTMHREEQKADAIRRENREKFRIAHPEKVTILPLILSGQRIKVSVYPPSSTEEEKHSAAEELVRKAYNAWFQNAVEKIQEADRSKEFADILPILSRGVPIQFVDFVDNQEDVWVAIEDTLEKVEKACGEDSVGCEAPGTEESSISVTVFEYGRYSDLLHELGHTLGLDEAYVSKKEFMSHTNRSDKLINDTVMNTHDTPLTADDADGLINIIDAWRIKKTQTQYPADWCKHIPSRVKNGWDSLHKEKNSRSVQRYAMGNSASLLPDVQKCPDETPLTRPQKKQEKRPSSSVRPPANERASSVTSTQQAIRTDIKKTGKRLVLGG